MRKWKRLMRFEQLEDRSMLDTVSWGQVDQSQTVLTACDGAFGDPKWWVMDQSTTPPTWTSHPTPDQTADIKFGVIGKSGITIPSPQTVHAIQASRGQTTLYVADSLGALANIWVIDSDQGQTTELTITTAPAQPIVGKLSTSMVCAGNPFGNGENVELNLANIAVTTSGGTGIVVNDTTAKLSMTNGSSFDAGMGKIEVAPTDNGTLIVDQSSLRSTGDLSVGNSAAQAPPQQATLEVRNGGRINTNSLHLDNHASLAVADGSQVFVGNVGPQSLSNNSYVNASTATITKGSQFAMARDVFIYLGAVSVSNNNSQITVERSAHISQSALTASDGANVSVRSVLVLNSGAVTLSDSGTTATSSTLLVKGTKTTLAKVVVNDGASLVTTSDMSSSTRIGSGIHANGEVDINAGASWTSSGGINVGEAGGKGVLCVAGTVQSTGYNSVNANSKAIVDGAWSISNGGSNGDLDVDGGVLKGTGSITAAHKISAGTGGKVEGTLQLTAPTVDLHPTSMIMPGNAETGPAIGTISLSGNLFLGGTFVVDVLGGNAQAPASSDLLTVTGTVNLIGGVLGVNLPAGFCLDVGTQFVVLTTSGGTEGTTFASSPEGKSLGNGYFWHVDYSDPTKVVLEVVRAEGIAVAGAQKAVPVTAPVAEIQGLGAAELATLQAAVAWGDASGSDVIASTPSAAGWIALDETGNAVVHGIHAYARPGAYAIRTTFSTGGGAICTVDSAVAVAAGALTVEGLGGVGFTQNTPSDTLVATVAGTAASSADLAAMIDWGDGAITPGRVCPDAQDPELAHVWTGQMHTYATTESHTITVTVCDKYGTSASDTLFTTTAASSNTLSYTSYGITLAPTTGLAATANVEFPAVEVPLASFSANNSAAQDYLALLVWGEGKVSAGEVRSFGGDAFGIYGSYTFSQAGAQPIGVLLHRRDDAFFGDSWTTQLTVEVHADLEFTPRPVTSTDLAGSHLALVATFSDTNPAAVSADFTATIAWGGVSQSATVVPRGPNQFDVYAPLGALGSGSDQAMTVSVTNSVDGSFGAVDLTSFIMDSGGTVTLDGLPTGSDLTLTNGTTLDLNGGSVDLATVTLTDGTITNGSIDAASYSLENGWLDADLAGGPVTKQGDGYVALSGENTFGDVTINGGTLAAAGSAKQSKRTLASYRDSLPSMAA